MTPQDNNPSHVNGDEHGAPLQRDAPGNQALVHVVELAREQLNGVVEEEHHQQQKELLLRKAAAPKRGGALMLGLAAACVIALALWWFALPNTLTVAVTGAGPGADAFALLAAQEAPVALQFGDGSQIQLSRGSRGQLLNLGETGATWELREGTALVRVVPRSKARWLLRAGPYEVLVTGTAFSLEWHTNNASLSIEMERGSVVVSGGAAAQGIPLAAGQRLVATGEAVKIEAAPITAAQVPDESGAKAAVASAQPDNHPGAASQPDTPDADAAAAPTGAPLAAVSARAAVTAKPTAQPSPSPALAAVKRDSWSALVARGAFADVVDQAEQRGTAQVLQTAGVQDLGALADAARYVKRGTLARDALLAQRRRFAGSRSARAAAFILGTMADAGGNSSEALALYQAYLAEGGGSFSPEALGRAMVASSRGGNATRTKTLAKRYLSRYPAGPHASSAKRILEQSSAIQPPKGPRDAPTHSP